MLVLMAGNILADCGKDKYAPCSCSTDTKMETTITCNRATVSTVKTMFSNVKKYYFDNLIITPNSKDTMIPAGLIGNHTFGGLTINCPSRLTPLVIDQTSFSLTKTKTNSLNIKNCDLSKLDWSFIKDFKTLSELTVAFSSNLHTMFYTFPGSTLTSLKDLTLTSITGMNGFANSSLKYPPILAAGLDYVEISYCYDLSDAALDRFLTKWLLPSGMDTIDDLIISGNSLPGFR